MDYDRLFAFTVFADHLNFTHAARLLHVSQPALHVQIRKLADEVGRPLYRRHGKVLSLTPEGKRLAGFGRDVQQRGRAVLDELRGQPPGPVVLAAGQGAFLYLLGPAIRRFHKQRWPLRLESLSGTAAIEAVRDARAQLCVVAIDDPPADLAATPLRSVGQIVVLPASHRLARRRSLSPVDLGGEPVIVAPAGRPHRVMLQQLMRASGCELRVAVEATGWEVMLQFARYGLGLAVVNDFCPVPRGLVGIPLDGAPRATYHLLERPGGTAEGAAALRRLIVETAGL